MKVFNPVGFQCLQLFLVIRIPIFLHHFLVPRIGMDLGSFQEYPGQHDDGQDNDGIMIHGTRLQAGHFQDKTPVQGNAYSNDYHQPEEVPQKHKGVEGGDVIGEKVFCGETGQGVHQEKEHKPPVYEHMHAPAQCIFFEHPSLEKHVYDKYFDQCDYFWAEQGAQNAFHRSRYP